MFCTFLALTCAFPTESSSPIKLSEQQEKVPTYDHRPLADQQVPSVGVNDPKPKRDTSVIDTKKYQTDTVKGHDTASSTFIRPVPVSQILGKTNTETKNTQDKSWVDIGIIH